MGIRARDPLLCARASSRNAEPENELRRVDGTAHGVGSSTVSVTQSISALIAVGPTQGGKAGLSMGSSAQPGVSLGGLRVASRPTYKKIVAVAPEQEVVPSNVDAYPVSRSKFNRTEVNAGLDLRVGTLRS
jgi:hypothetical protein